MDMLLNLSLHRLKILSNGYLKQHWLTEVVKNIKVFWDSTLKYQAQEKARPLTKKEKKEFGSVEEH